jgi:AraC-like DNA-binding protein
MATSDIDMNTLCIKCGAKSGGLFMCHGCHKSFCWKHTLEHKQELSLQMDIIAQDHDLLQQDLNHQSMHHPLLIQIDQWEKESIIKIQKIAEEARMDVKTKVQESKDQLQTLCTKIIDELRLSRESDDFSEVEITGWTARLKQIRQQLETPTEIQISYYEDMAPIRMIKMKQETTVVSHQSNAKVKT